MYIIINVVRITQKKERVKYKLNYKFSQSLLDLFILFDVFTFRNDKQLIFYSWY